MNKLWYKEPAKVWEEALPIGNGRLGAMIFGGAQEELLQLNEDSIWYGAHVDRNNPDALANLERVRALILNGKISEAERLLTYAFSGTPASERPYQTLGELKIYFQEMGDGKDYYRELDIDEAVHSVSYRTEHHGEIRRETFASAKDNLIVMRIRAEKAISITLTLNRSHFYNRIYRYQSDTIVMDGELGAGGNSFAVMLRAEAEGGKVEVIGEHLLVQEATEITLYLTTDTDFYRQKRANSALKDSSIVIEEKEIPGLLAAEAARVIDAATTLGYTKLRQRHREDYRELFQRVSIDLGNSSELDKLSTKERLDRINEEHPDHGLLALYFQFGRYLMISGSRPGTLPLNLQGIWNKDFMPAWGSKFTININTEMNYWPAEVCNLSECHEPLFDLLERMVDRGRETARKMYGCRGFVAHHNTDIYGDTAPQDIYIPATYWVMGAAWLCTHLWEHYLFTMDKEFLRKYYPIMKEAAVFFEDFLIENKGYLVTCPSVSPENTYILPSGERGCMCAGASMDNQILNDLFTQCIKASEILEEGGTCIEEWKEILDRLPPITIGKQGQIMEWSEDYEEAEPGHRHISHLYALHPSHQIKVDKTPQLAQAARKTLKNRLLGGGGHTGWSRAWIINMYARLWDGEEAYSHLIKLMTQSTLSNLFDNHPPFQIDGNFGATAGIAEMLVQSDEERIVLLPALPREWNSGSVSGLCLRGGAEITIQWKDDQLHEAVILPRHDYETMVCYGEDQRRVCLKKGEEYIYRI